MKYFISSLGFWSKNVKSILNKNILLLKRKKKRSTIYTLSTQIHNCSLSWLGTGTSMKRDGVKLVYWTKTAFSQWNDVSNMPTLTYNPEKSIILKDAIIVKLMHNTFNLRYTDVTICTIVFLLKRADKTFFSYFRIYNTF